MFIDAKKAHLNPKCEEDVYIELPTEAKRGVNQCGKLNFWSYGFRPAAQAWEKFYAEKLEAAGFIRGIGCSVVFYNEELDMSCEVHGDDFAFWGYDKDLRMLAKEIEPWFELKVRDWVKSLETIRRWRFWGGL